MTGPEGPAGIAAWGALTGTLSNQTDLQTALDGKSATAHTHTGVYEPANANLQAHVASAHAPAGAEVNINADWTAVSGDAQILNKPTIAAAPVTLTSTTLQSDAVIATYTPITGLSFTPAASTNYLLDCLIRYTSTAATTGINFAWDVPAAVTSIQMSGYTTTTALGANEGFSQRADNVGTPTTAAVITVENVAVLHTQLRNGANATATSLGFTPETANSVSVVAGSVCQVRSY